MWLDARARSKQCGTGKTVFLFWFSCKMGDRSLVATIDDFVNPEKGEEARTDALNTLLIRTLPPPLL
jgi:hypothetical protein